MMTTGNVPSLSVPRPRSSPGTASARLDVLVEPHGWGGLLDGLSAGARGRSLSLHLRGSAPADWPSDEQLGRLVALGAMELEVPWVMELGVAQPERSVHFLRFLRDCMSHGLRVAWRGRLGEALPEWVLSHLEPPGAEGAGGALERWREGHDYGRCYWRSGPGFVLVRDCRVGRDAARFTIDDPATLRTFLALGIPRHVSEVRTDAAAEDALVSLLEERLALQLGEWLVALPYRLRRWPVPAMAI